MKLKLGGDIGDCIYACSIIKQIDGGPHDLCFVDHEGCARDFTKRSHLVIPLLETQPYIKSAKNSKEPCDIDFTQFRRFHGNTTTLPQAQAIHIGFQHDVIITDHGTTPWLKISPKWKSKGGVVIARSPRYNNPEMPWGKIVEHYGWNRITFIGLVEEHKNFCREYGSVPYQKTKNMLEVAHLIAESKLFIGNQSAPMSVAVGMGHPYIQEVSLDQPDCIFSRSNAQYVADGSVVLPDVDGSGELNLTKPPPDVSFFSRAVVPPGYWQYPELPASVNFTTQKILVAKLEKCDDATADQKLMHHNVARIPAFFTNMGSNPLEHYKTAYQKAFNKLPPL